MISMITEREKICYMIGILGDSTKKESLEALKFLTSWVVKDLFSWLLNIGKSSFFSIDLSDKEIIFLSIL